MLFVRTIEVDKIEMEMSFLRKPEPLNLEEANRIIELLWKENVFLRSEIIRMSQGQEELEEKLRTDSRNSSIPPSQESHKKKKRNVVDFPSVKRKQGAQKGHKGKGRKLVPEEEVTSICRCHPPAVCECGGSVSVKEGYSRHQQYELPKVEPIITEFQIYSGKCANCGKKHDGQLPEGTPAGMLGPRAMAQIASLSGDYTLSKREVVRICEDSFGLPVSVGTVSNTEKQVSKALEKPVEEAKEYIKTQDVVNCDETSHKQGVQKQWMWTAVTKYVTVLVIFATRGKIAAQQLIGEKFKGILVSDRFSSYNWVEHLRRQLCWAHLIRDFVKISERKGAGGQTGEKLLSLAKEMFKMWDKVKKGKLSWEAFQSAMIPIRQSVEKLLEEGVAKGDKKTKGTCAKLLKIKEAMWTFIDTPGVEPTNNAAEQSLRPYVIWRKKCFGTNSERGNRFIERMMTVRVTCRQQGRNVLDFITESINSNLSGKPSPSLLPSEKIQESLKIAA